MLDAVPFDVDTQMDEISTWASHDVVFDARVSFLDFTELEATQYIFENYAHLTTGLSLKTCILLVIEYKIVILLN